MSEAVLKPALDWQAAGDYSDIKYEKAEGIAKITINRPERRNAFRPQTVHQMSTALNDARDDETIGVIILTGEGEKRFVLEEIRKYAVMRAIKIATEQIV